MDNRKAGIGAGIRVKTSLKSESKNLKVAKSGIPKVLLP